MDTLPKNQPNDSGDIASISGSYPEEKTAPAFGAEKPPTEPPLPPIGEETLMRGYLYSGLRSRLHFWPALLITSLLFGVAHLSTGVSGPLWAAAVDTFILSAVLVYLREKTGALYAPIMLHGLNNLVAFFAHFYT